MAKNARNGYFWRIEMRMVPRKIGKILLSGSDWTPLYSIVNHMAPYFATKQRAVEMIRHRKMGQYKGIRYRVKRVRIEVCDD